MTSTKTPEKVSEDISRSIQMADEKSKAVEALDWSTIVTAEQAYKAFEALGIKITRAEDYGDGFKLIEDKSRLVGVPFICVNARTTAGDHGDFSILHVITEHNDKLIVTDGSTGIHKQVLTHGRAAFIGLFCPSGLTVSEYEYESVDEKTGEVKMKPAKTYYVDGMR